MYKRKNQMKMILPLLLLIYLVGCAHIGTVKSQLDEQTFQTENLPYRDLSVAVISEGAWPKESIEATINDASNLMAKQVGIRLRIDRWIDHPLPSFSPMEGLKNVVEIIGKDQEKYDFVIGFSSRSVASHLIEVAIWSAWLGAIDDSYRKFIIIKHLDERVLMHELCHAFVFEKSHGMSGVLTAALFKVPLVPALFNFPRYVSKGNRKEILTNKWRSFNEKPVIPEEHQWDKVEVPAP
jgi:hypothetical protein